MDNIFFKLNCYFKGNWNLAVLDVTIGRWLVDTLISNIPYLKAQNSKGRHIVMQPSHHIESYYLMVDDIDISTMHIQHKDSKGNWKPGRMVVETSPDNYQVWIHCSRSMHLNEKRYWLKKMHNDPGADPNNRWGRCPGFRNRKEKYKSENGGYPLAKLIWVDWKNTTDIPLRLPSKDVDTSKPFSPLPLGGVCRFEVNRSHYLRSDESSTDFAYALALMRRGYTNEQIRSRIKIERVDWKNHKGAQKQEYYINCTIKKARDVIMRS